jgi:O-antigen biosynthesis protein WbqV
MPVRNGLGRRPIFRLLPLAHDVAMAGMAAILAVVLRVGVDYAADLPSFLIQIGGVFALVSLPVFLLTGSYHASWRFVSTLEALALARAAVIANLLFLPALFVVTRLELLPRSFVVINIFTTTALLVGPRLLVRLFREGRIAFDPIRAPRGRAALILGNGPQAELLLRGLEIGTDRPIRPVGILTRAGESQSGRLRGVPVLGTLDDLEEIVEMLAARDDRAQQLIIADDTLSPRDLKALVDRVAPLRLLLAQAPKVTELQPGPGGKAALRPVVIEDLLGRPTAALDLAPVEALVRGRRVLVTGAGGSIGSEMVRQLARFGPALITLIDAHELALYEIDGEMARDFPLIARQSLLIDVRMRTQLAKAIHEIKPELIFHAAALKHVPLVESNPIAGAATNILGTVNLADAARDVGALAMVLISTDKAVNPSSFMGATKRVAETYAQALDLAAAPGTTRFVTVRFGNVLGSTGSVVPLFSKQLARGGPITVTHPDMKRFFMTIGEAVSLVLQASADALAADRAQAGDHIGGGRIHVLDMGEQMPIIELAREMIRLAGLVPDQDIQITFTGLRPGEKLEEELFHDAEPPVATRVPGVLLAAPRVADLNQTKAAIQRIEAAIQVADANAVLDAVSALVPEWMGRAPQAGQTAGA